MNVKKAILLIVLVCALSTVSARSRRRRRSSNIDLKTGQCKNGTVNSFGSMRGVRTCKSCGVGKYYSTTSFCTSNTTTAEELNGNNSEECCISCQSGKYSDGKQPECLSCAPGHFSSDVAKKCEQCGYGKYQSSNSSSSCIGEMCPDFYRSTLGCTTKECAKCKDCMTADRITSAVGYLFPSIVIFGMILYVYTKIKPQFCCDLVLILIVSGLLSLLTFLGLTSIGLNILCYHVTFTFVKYPDTHSINFGYFLAFPSCICITILIYYCMKSLFLFCRWIIIQIYNYMKSHLCKVLPTNNNDKEKKDVQKSDAHVQVPVEVQTKGTI